MHGDLILGKGLVGLAMLRVANRREIPVTVLGRHQCDLRDAGQLASVMRVASPARVVVAAAVVGGIEANMSRPAEFIYDNLLIAANVLQAARECGVRKLLYLGSSCVYPRDAPQPMREECLLTGPLEPTNEPYAIAKIAGVKMCQAYRRQFGCDFIAAMPTNLYGPHDNFHATDSHVIPGLLRRFHEAKLRGEKEVAVWGSGRPRRELLEEITFRKTNKRFMGQLCVRSEARCGRCREIRRRTSPLLVAQPARVLNPTANSGIVVRHGDKTPCPHPTKTVVCVADRRCPQAKRSA